MKNYISMFATAALSCLVILFFATYSEGHGIIVTFGHMWSLISQTVLGTHLRANYYGVTPIELWYSVRLVVLAVLLAVGIGILLTLVRVKSRAYVKTIVEIPFALLESIPEPLYVVLAVLLLLFFLEHTNIVLPAFPEADPSWVDTIAPALALGLPGSFYLSRILELNIRNQLQSPYVVTAKSKGLSARNIFYRHIAANVTPVLILQIAAVCTITLSTLLFTEYMMTYKGALFKLAEYGFFKIQRPAGIPLYEPGLIFLVGSLLVGIWFVCTLLCNIYFDLRYPRDLVSYPSPQSSRRQISWIGAGAVLIAVVVLYSIFPQLVTHHGPNQEHLANLKTLVSAPFPPSAQFPLGTDYLGRDLLARTLAGTADTLLPAFGATLVSILIALASSTLAISNPDGLFSNSIRAVGRIFSGLPILIILMLVMRERNIHSPYQEIIYIAWIAVLEAGRSATMFLETYEHWYQFRFVEGALSIGRRRGSILFTHLRTWLQQFTVEVFFLEFSRILSLMTLLAVFQIYDVETLGYPEFFYSNHPVIISAHNSWFSIIGDITANGAYMNQEYFFYAPILCLLFITVGSNFIARGMRGKQISV